MTQHPSAAAAPAWARSLRVLLVNLPCASVKPMHVVAHARPRALWRVLAHPDPEQRAHLHWCFRNRHRVWRAEVGEPLGRRSRMTRPTTLAAFQKGGR